MAAWRTRRLDGWLHRAAETGGLAHRGRRRRGCLPRAPVSWQSGLPRPADESHRRQDAFETTDVSPAP